MLRALSFFIVLLALTGCDSFPCDAAGTTERMEQTGELRVAVLPSTPDAAPALAILADFAKARRARLIRTSLHGEHALRQLEEGRLDAVVGHFAKSSPWKSAVALSKSVAAPEPPDSHKPILRIARRNGENHFILATDRAIADDMP